MPKIDYEKWLRNFRAGLDGSENSRYDQTNDSIPDKTKQALGKYQFVPKYWWKSKDTPSNVKGIQEFGASKGKKMLTYQDFLDDKVLQEEYFEHYAKNFVKPQVEAIKKANPKTKYTDDVIAGMVHFEPKAAYKFVVNNQDRESTKVNPSMSEYVNRFNSGLKKNNLSPLKKEWDRGEAFGEFKNYKKEKESILNNDSSESLQALKIQELNKKYYKKGLIEVGPKGEPAGMFNEFITENNEFENNKLNSKRNDLNFRLETLSNYSVSTIEGEELDPTTKIKTGKKSNKLIGLGKYTVQDFGKDTEKELEIDLKKEGLFVPRPETFNGVNGKQKDLGNIEWNKKQKKIGFKEFSLNNYLKETQEMYRDVTGDKNFQLVKFDSKGNVYRGKDMKIDLNNENILLNKITGGKNYSGKLIDLPKDIKVKKSESNQIIPIADWDIEEEEIVIKENEETSNEENSVKKEEEVKQSEIDVREKKLLQEEFRKQETESNFTDNWNQEILDPDQKTYDPNNYKNDFPFADVLGSAAGIAIGSKMANKDIPLRDEQVSGAVRNYAAELAKLSQIGLRPEEEAKAKTMISEVYQSGLEQITKASGGNRNTVLGNLGRLDAQKQGGLINLALGDAAAKNENLAKYGQIMQYINEFDSRRDIANNERKYQDTMLTKRAGGELVAGSIKSLLDNVQYYKNNKPGSINHAFKSHMYLKMFNIDPAIKDNGLGDTYGTLSYQKKVQSEALAVTTKNKETQKKALALNPQQLNMLSEFSAKHGARSEITRNLIDYVYDNKINTALDESKLQEASSSKDLSLLFPQAPKTNENGDIVEVESTKTESGLPQTVIPPLVNTNPNVQTAFPTTNTNGLNSKDPEIVAAQERIANINKETLKINEESQAEMQRMKSTNTVLENTNFKAEEEILNSEYNNEVLESTIGKIQEDTRQLAYKFPTIH
jgi:hypothetical protein